MKGCDCEKWKASANIGFNTAMLGNNAKFTPWYEVYEAYYPELKANFCPFCGAELKEETE